MVKKKKEIKSSKKRTIYDLLGGDKEFTKENFIEGAVIRPLVFMIAFVSFLVSIFFILAGDYKWGGSFIIFSFIFNLYSIYQSFSDEPSIFRTLNLAFKIVMFIGEIVMFNWLAVKSGLYIALSIL